MSAVQCPVCTLRFRFQSELEAHAQQDHCLQAEVALAPHSAVHRHYTAKESDRSTFVRPPA